MNNHLNTLLQSLRENFNLDDEEELEEASNSTDAYAGGEGPQRTPFAFGGSEKQRKRKFAKKSAAYSENAADTNKWFVKVEGIYKQIESRISEITGEPIEEEIQFVQAIDVRQMATILRTILKEFNLQIFSRGKADRQPGSSRIGLRFNLTGPGMNEAGLIQASNAVRNELTQYSNVSSVNLRYGKTASGVYPYLVIYLRRIGRNESVVREDANSTTALDGGGSSISVQASGPDVFQDKEDRKKSRRQTLDKVETIPGEEFEEQNENNLLNEISYQNYRSDETVSPKQKINQTIKEINSKLSEVEKMIGHSQKFKNEIGADNGVFYKDTIARFQKISERLLRISAKIREYNS